ncbi:conserved serine-rich protein [Diplodia corticola]|uniref:Conserved serine-rich protein n=1 Tax=Diplodia corticola TaxID=236234 RepID=A0A1J9SHE4_9PEZI|nr:conserved serine-rich protein [Diplodia corticola]OJD39799.1 conserved serine-rich protein [Diplodia corticola]
MAFLRPVSSLRSAATLRPTVASSRPMLAFATRSYAHSGYGDGKGDPAGENPQKQPPAKSRDIEHPGPPPPDVGKGTDASAATTGSKGTSSGGGGGGEKKSQNSHAVKGAEPKILNENPPSEQDPEVQQHNKEMEQRAERAETKISNEDAEKDKVPASFWSGKCLPLAEIAVRVTDGVGAGHGGTKGA